MKIKYVCEICGNMFDREEEARECEARGVFDKTKFPIGLMYRYDHGGYVGIFAVAEYTHSLSHAGGWNSYACRESSLHGDTLNGAVCQGGYLTTNPRKLEVWVECHHLTSEDLQRNEAKRIIIYLKSLGITPSAYDETGQIFVVS